MTLSCLAPGCALPRQHIPGCDTDCRGCLPALAEVGVFCDRHFAETRTLLAEIPDLWARLPDVLEPGVGHTQRVSGTPEASAPLSLDAFDLHADPRAGAVHDDNHDQIGQPSVAGVLDLWCRWFAEDLGHTLPPAEVPALAGWLSARLEWAAKNHPAVDEFLGELRDLRARLIRAVGDTEPRPEICHGVPCRRCDLLSLWRLADGTGGVECSNPNCRTVYRPEEYQQWVGMVSAAIRRQAREDEFAHGATA